MANDTRLLAHLAHRLGTHPEDIATEALAFLLQRSASMSSAFWNAIKPLAPDLPQPVSFRAQVSQAGGTRPDIVGFDAANREVVMIEAKFWAGLTANQPVAYLERLSGNGPTASALVVVAPGQRLESLWPELLRLCRESGHYPEFSTCVDATHARVASATHNISLVLTTWTHVLSALIAQASSDGDSSMVSDLLQLQSLADQEDDEAFLPVQSFELGQDFPRRMVLFNSLVDDLVQRAQAEGVVGRPGLRMSRSPMRPGRYVHIGATGAWVGISFEFWRRYRPTPLWLEIGTWAERDTETLDEKRLRLRPLEEGSKLVALSDSLLMPLEIPLGVERGEVLEALLEQLRMVRNLLPVLPTAPVAPDLSGRSAATASATQRGPAPFADMLAGPDPTSGFGDDRSEERNPFPGSGEPSAAPHDPASKNF